MGDMAIFKANFIPKQVNARSVAKAHIRYIEHRPGKDGEKITRTLYNADGVMGRWEAYRMIDEAEKGSVFYRLVINFDSQKEDTRKDIYVQEVIEKTMLGLEDRVAQHIQWVAATHDDHTPLRHVHILAILPKRLQVADLQAVRLMATEAALEQRSQRDKALEQKREREEAQWER